MDKKYYKSKNKYWETEEGELIEFGNSFMRCFDKAGKLQFGSFFFDRKTGEKKYITKFTIDREELIGSDEGADYLMQTIEDWKTGYHED